MNVNLFVSIVCIVSLILGVFIGSLIFKISNRKKDKKIIENAKEVLDGKRKNVIIIDGQVYDATKFVLREDDGQETIVELKGGGIIRNGKGKEEENREEETSKQNTNTVRKNSNSVRSKKRNLKSIFRRFG